MVPGSTTTDISNFVAELFRDEVGVVYAPIKDGYWKQRFFNWPEQKELLIEHLSATGGRDVYLSPMLFTEPRVHPSTFKGTFHLWTEFDGNAPRDPPIPPSIRIQSGKQGYEHWYWRLDSFTTSKDILQEYSKRLTYQLEADLSAWDYAVVLRPPGTYNHKREKPTILLENNEITYPLDTFVTLPAVPDHVAVKVSKVDLPELQSLIAKYQWNEDAYDLLTKTLDEVGNKTGHRDRSAALCRLAIHCVDMGMSNEEIYVVIDDADRRWQKYTHRTDRDRRLEGILSYARSKRAEITEYTDDTVVYRFKDFLATEVHLKWVVTGLIPVAGSAVLFGPSTVGKSTLALRLGIAIATGEKEFLGWPIEKTQKVLFTSLEMPHDELKYFLNQMNLTDEQLHLLQENFFIWPMGYPYPYDVKDQQIEILKYIDRYGIEFNIIDSLGEAAYGSISSQDDMKRLYSFLNEDVRRKRGCGYLFIHHPRKPGQGDKKVPDSFDDAYGDSYIINRAQTVINLNPKGLNRLQVNIFKSRLSMENKSFTIIRNSDRSFTREETKPSKQEELKKEVYNDSPGILSFGSNKK